jgi:hypothetical protein
MSDWIHALPLGWMAVLIFGLTFLITAAIHWVVQSLAVGDRVRVFKGVTPGLLPPLGIIFGLLVAFLASQVWGDLDRARTAVNREASALRAAVILSETFPEQGAHLRGLIRQHIQDAERDEWPAMASRARRSRSFRHRWLKRCAPPSHCLCRLKGQWPRNGRSSPRCRTRSRPGASGS